MNWDQIIVGIGSSGPMGVLCCLLLWRDWKRDEREAEREKRREQADKDRTDADKALAASMTLLAERIR